MFTTIGDAIAPDEPVTIAGIRTFSISHDHELATVLPQPGEGRGQLERRSGLSAERTSCGYDARRRAPVEPPALTVSRQADCERRQGRPRPDWRLAWIHG